MGREGLKAGQVGWQCTARAGSTTVDGMGRARRWHAQSIMASSGMRQASGMQPVWKRSACVS